MDCMYKGCIIDWLSSILRYDVTLEDLKSGKCLVALANLSGECAITEGDLLSSKAIDQFSAFLDSAYNFSASSLFNINQIFGKDATDEELFGLCLMVLITCLQCRSGQFYMAAALDLDFATQSVILHLLHEPMTQLSIGQHLTRESVLTGLQTALSKHRGLSTPGLFGQNNNPHSSPPITEQNETAITPIKAAPKKPAIPLPAYDGKNLGPGVPNGDEPFHSQTNEHDVHHEPDLVSVSPTTDTQKESTLAESDLFRVPAPVRTSKHMPTGGKASESVGVTKFSARNEEFYTVDCFQDNLRFDRSSLSSKPPCLSPTAHDFQPQLPTSDARTVAGHRRPTDLSLRLDTSKDQCSFHASPAPSGATSLGDLSDTSSLPKGHIQSLASPLTSLKHLLDSPLWTQKTRWRESEREKRKMAIELDRERAYRYEVENVVAELRTQLDDARVRATEAEAKVIRLSREVTALQDQTDELNMCRADLALREDEIANLKERLNLLHELLPRSRKLEAANASLQQECADYRLKIDQLTTKLTEIKDRHIVYTELEALRCKLKDVEAQLAQQLRDSEAAQKDARCQREMYNHLKVQRSLTEMRRTKSYRTTNPICHPSLSNYSIGKSQSLRCLSDTTEVEFDDGDNTVANFLNNSLPGSSERICERAVLSPGQNLASLWDAEFDRRIERISHSQADRFTQTTPSLADLGQVLPEAEPLDDLDCDMSPDQLDEDLSLHYDMSHATYEALSADRRGLSDELVRLHNELTESSSYAQQLEQQVSELRERLDRSERTLQQQTTLCNRAQENWALLERKDRMADEQLTRLRSQHAEELDAVRAELTHQINRMQSERDEFRRKLSEVSDKLAELNVDRDRLSELNSVLRRELATTKSLMDAMIQNKPIVTNRNLPRGRMTDVSFNNKDHNHLFTDSSVEEWVEAACMERDRRNKSGPLASTDTDAYSQSSDYLSEDGSLTRLRHNKMGTNCVSNSLMPKRQDGSHLEHFTENSQHISEKLAHLSSRTAQLEWVALALSEQRTQLLSSGRLTEPSPSSLPVSSTSGYEATPGACSTKVLSYTSPHPVPDPTSNPGSAPVVLARSVENMMDPGLDTDADSSAFTDLSKVSPASKNGYSVTHVQSAADRYHSHCPANMPKCADLTGRTPSYQTDNGDRTCSLDPRHYPSQVSRPLASCSLLKPHPTVNSDNSPVLDARRIGELHRRNRLQPFHLRSSYPVETQVVEPKHVVDALGHLLPTPSRYDCKSGRRYRVVSDESSASASVNHGSGAYGRVLREVGDDNLIRPEPIKPTLSTDGAQLDSLLEIRSPMAAGFQPVPKSIQAITDALIAASHDPSAMASALINRLSRSLSIECSTSKTHGDSPNQHSFSGPDTELMPQRNSIAFEIPNDAPIGGVRRLPQRRVPPSTRIRRNCALPDPKRTHTTNTVV